MNEDIRYYLANQHGWQDGSDPFFTEGVFFAIIGKAHT